MDNLTNIRVTADRFVDIWVVRVFWMRQGPLTEELADFHRLDMRDKLDTEDPFEKWLEVAEELTESLVIRHRWENGR